MLSRFVIGPNLRKRGSPPPIDPVDSNKTLCVSLIYSGAVAQLGERLNRTQEVVGSIPISSTS